MNRFNCIKYPKYLDKATVMLNVPESGYARVNHDNCPAGVDRKKRLWVCRAGDVIHAYCHHCNGVYHQGPKQEKQARKDKVRRISKVVFDSYVTSSAVAEYLGNYLDSDTVDTFFNQGAEHNEYACELIDADHNSYGYHTRDVVTKKIKTYFTESGAQSGHWIRNFCRKSDMIVIVEDIISAHAVAKKFDSLALLGTQVDAYMINHLKSMKIVVLWLDNDATAEVAKAKILKQLAYYAPDVKVLTIDKPYSDPKFYTPEQINYAINKVLGK